MSRPVVILSTADMNATVWTNKQHIATRLAASRTVVYIESFGLRRPTISWRDLRRISRRIRGHSKKAVGRNNTQATVISPILMPFHGILPCRLWNHFLVHRIIRRLPPGYILWSFSPVTYGLERHAAASVYQSVDLLHTIRHVPARTTLRAERRFVQKADHMLASSSEVQMHLVKASGGRHVELWENVADLAMFERHRSLRREPVAIFCGNLTPSKVDFALLQSIADSGVQLHLAGPIAIDGAGQTPLLNSLFQMRNVQYLGVLSQEEMAMACGSARVGLIPYLINDYTRGVFPMKVYEYLAAGLRVVSTPLPSLRQGQIDGLHVSGPEGFAQAVGEALLGKALVPTPASKHGWPRRMEQIEQLLDILEDKADHTTAPSAGAR